MLGKILILWQDLEGPLECMGDGGHRTEGKSGGRGASLGCESAMWIDRDAVVTLPCRSGVGGRNTFKKHFKEILLYILCE